MTATEYRLTLDPDTRTALEQLSIAEENYLAYHQQRDDLDDFLDALAEQIDLTRPFAA